MVIGQKFCFFEEPDQERIVVVDLKKMHRKLETKLVCARRPMNDEAVELVKQNTDDKSRRPVVNESTSKSRAELLRHHWRPLDP